MWALPRLNRADCCCPGEKKKSKEREELHQLHAQLAPLIPDNAPRAAEESNADPRKRKPIPPPECAFAKKRKVEAHGQEQCAHSSTSSDFAAEPQSGCSTPETLPPTESNMDSMEDSWDDWAELPFSGCGLVCGLGGCVVPINIIDPISPCFIKECIPECVQQCN